MGPIYLGSAFCPELTLKSDSDQMLTQAPAPTLTPPEPVPDQDVVTVQLYTTVHTVQRGV